MAEVVWGSTGPVGSLAAREGAMCANKQAKRKARTPKIVTRLPHVAILAERFSKTTPLFAWLFPATITARIGVIRIASTVETVRVVLGLTADQVGSVFRTARGLP